MKIQHLMFYEAYEPSDRAKLFHQTADAQRGPPEQAMLQIQRLVGGGVFSYVVEHVGDITHRMAQKFDYGKGQLGIVADKVEKTLSTLESGYGFDKEMQENFESNFRFNKENYPEDFKFEDIRDFIGEARKLSVLYAHEHSQIPVFNEPQMHAREAAVELGKWNYDGAITHLRWLKKLTDDEEKYYEEVGKITMGEGTDNGFYLTQLTGAGPTIYPLPTNAKEYEDIDSPRRGGADASFFEDDDDRLVEGGFVRAGWFNPKTGEHLKNPSPLSISHDELWQQSRGGEFISAMKFSVIYDQGFVRYWLIGTPEQGRLVLSGNEEDLNSSEFKKFMSTLPIHDKFELVVNNKNLGTFNES